MGARRGRLVAVSVQREEDADDRELNDAAADTPVYVVFAYSEGLLNKAGVAALGLTPATKAAGRELPSLSTAVPSFANRLPCTQGSPEAAVAVGRR